MAKGQKGFSVKISGKKGSVYIEANEAETYGEAVQVAVELLGLEGFEVSGLKLLVNGNPVEHDAPVQDGDHIDAVPAARLG